MLGYFSRVASRGAVESVSKFLQSMDRSPDGFDCFLFIHIFIFDLHGLYLACIPLEMRSCSFLVASLGDLASMGIIWSG